MWEPTEVLPLLHDWFGGKASIILWISFLFQE